MKRILMTLCAALTLGAASAAGTTPALGDEKSLYDLLDLERPGMEAVKKAVAKGNVAAADKELLKYFRTRKPVELFGLDLENVKVEAEEFDGLARAEIFQQFLVRGGDVAFGDGFLHGLHARTFEVQQVVERLFVAQSRGGSGGRCRAERQCGAEGHQDSFHGCYFRLYFVPLILTCSRFPRQTASTRCPAASSAGSSTVTSRTGFPARFRTVKA